ncbi:MAG: transcriptional repressor LexA [Chloroflexi bacterium]|nr:MAG: transcriptional repressor LexA [Chloroflexota bacterium]
MKDKSFDQLSDRQKNILRFIDRYLAENGFPPTIREVGEATKIDSTSVVNYNLNKLADAGFIERTAAKSRGLRLLKPIPGARHRKVKATGEVFKIPHVGQIVAGEPINVDAYEDEEKAVEIPVSFLRGIDPQDVFALTVQGDSMIDAMIQDGDTVVLRRVEKANNGEMVAVWLTDREETTLKYFYNEGDRIRLQPAHPTMQPIYVDARHCQIQGKVLSVMRRLK